MKKMTMPRRNCFAYLLVIITCFSVVSCDGSSDGSSQLIFGTWRGVVNYDKTSCGDEVPDFIPDISGEEYVITVFEPSDKQFPCDIKAVDQTGRYYFLNVAETEQVCEFDPYVFAPEEEEDPSSPLTAPTGINFRNVTELDADVSLPFFLNRFSICRFIGKFTRES